MGCNITSNKVRLRDMDKGFTLIELLIVLVIASLLAFMIYPNNQNHIARAHRIDGQSALFDLAHRLEQYHIKYSTYKEASIGTGNLTDIMVSSQSPLGYYTLSITQASDTAYTIQAIPTPIQAAGDSACQILTLTSSGHRNTRCW